MSNYNSFIIPPIQTKNESNCLEQYYRYIVGMSMNQQSKIAKTQNNPVTVITNSIIQQNDANQYANQYQKIYVDTLVDITTLTIRTSWPMEMSTTKEGQPVVNTHAFVRHLLKRSRATRSTLQLAIFYLFRIRPHIAIRSQLNPIVKCGRRMFLAALICAHKFLYDNTFTNASWAKISKLPVKEINAAERAILEILDYRLYVCTELYQKFESQLKEAVPVPNNTSENVNTLNTISNNKKRNYLSSTEPHQHTIKKPKSQQQNAIQFTYGIPTPVDDKVEP